MSFSANALPCGSTRFVRRALSAFSAALLFSGCQVDADPQPIAAITFRIAGDSLLRGKTYPTQVVLTDALGKELTNRKVTYTSLSQAVATVDASGVITGVGVGNTAITAASEGRTATFSAKVLEPVTRIVVSPVSETMPNQATRQMVAALTAASGQAVAGRAVAWSSSNTAVASISPTGVVSAVGLGTTTIEAVSTFDNVRGSTTVTVIPQSVQTVQISPAGAQTLRLGGATNLTATLRDAANNVLTGRVINWISSNPAVASVAGNGNNATVSAIAVGTTQITAESENRTATVNITVTEVPIKRITISPDTFSVGTAATRQISFTAIDSLDRVVTNYANRNVAWTSSNAAVATVSIFGVATGVTAGTARIFLTVDQVRSNEITATVFDQVVSVRITPAQVPIVRVGGTTQLTATALNNQNLPIPGKTATWTSSNQSVASVSATGLVTGVAVGNATLTAEIDNRQAQVNVTVQLVPIGTITIAPANDTIAGGEQRQYNPVVTDSAGNAVISLQGRAVSWTTTNAPVANVTNQGIVSASAAQSGQAQIRVQIDGVLSNILNVTVAQIAQITATPNPLTVKAGNTQSITVVAKDASGTTVKTSRTFTFQITPGFATTVATVSPGGVVTGTTAGTTQITVTLSGVVGVAALIPVTVNP